MVCAIPPAGTYLDHRGAVAAKMDRGWETPTGAPCWGPSLSRGAL